MVQKQRGTTATVVGKLQKHVNYSGANSGGRWMAYSDLVGDSAQARPNKEAPTKATKV